MPFNQNIERTFWWINCCELKRKSKFVINHGHRNFAVQKEGKSSFWGIYFFFAKGLRRGVDYDVKIMFITKLFYRSFWWIFLGTIRKFRKLNVEGIAHWGRQAWSNVINCMNVDYKMIVCMNVYVISVKSFALKAGNFPQSETVLDKSFIWNWSLQRLPHIRLHIHKSFITNFFNF